MEKRFLITVGVFVLIIFGLMYLATDLDKKDTLPYRFQQNFIEGCMEEAVDYAYCSCAVDYLNENYTNDEIYEMEEELNINPERYPEGIFRAAEHCIDLY